MALQTVNSAAFSGFLESRGQGFQSAFFGTTANISHPDVGVGSYPWGSHYMRPSWGGARSNPADTTANINPNELPLENSAQGAYDFSQITSVLAFMNANNRTLDLGAVMVDNGVPSTFVPLWLENLGIARFPDGSVDWSDATLRLHYENLIMALGAAFDADPALNSVDVRGIGKTGEWESDIDFGPNPPVAYFPTIADQEWMYDLYIAAFPNTPLIGLRGYWTSAKTAGNGSNAFRIAPSYSTELADIKGTGWRADCWGSYINNGILNEAQHTHPQYGYQAQLAARPDIWQDGPIHLESCGNMAGDAGQTLSWIGAGEPIADIVTDTINFHTTSVHNKNGAVPASYRASLDPMFEQLGARLHLPSVTYDDLWTGNDSITLTLDNQGIAPPYADYRLAVRLKQGASVVGYGVSSQSVEGHLPGAQNYTFSVTTTPQPGSFDLEVGYVLAKAGNPHTSNNFPVASVGAGTANDGWLPLGPIVYSTSIYKIDGPIDWTVQ